MLRTRTSVLLCALLASPLAGAEDRYRIIVNPRNAVAALDRAELARFFMKRVTGWPDGTPVTAVDQERSAPVRAAFSKDVHERDADGVAAYWATQIYSGRGAPPVIKRSDDEVLDFVRRNPGAVGYVSAGAPLQGVKALSVR